MTWQVWIDTGGTFTDCVAIDPKGMFHSAKILSHSSLRGRVTEWVDESRVRIDGSWLRGTSRRKSGSPLPSDFFGRARIRFQYTSNKSTTRGLIDFESGIRDFDPNEQILSIGSSTVPNGEISSRVDSPMRFEIKFDEEAPILATRIVARIGADQPLPPMEMRLATTRGTNALLERRGAPTILFVTRGFRDLLTIGNQQRPDLFALKIIRPESLWAQVIEVSERIDAQGRVVEPIDAAELSQTLAELCVEPKNTSAAVALLNSHANSEHELMVADALVSCGFSNISISSSLAPLIHYLHRAETATVNAYLSPIIHGYLEHITASLNSRSSRIFMMTSAGGLQSASSYLAKDSLLSGPAGGIVGAVSVAGDANFHKIIAFDMGGTSTDVSRYDHRIDYDFEHTVGDAHLMVPAISIHTVAAGGGSICWFDGRRLRVGPQSAGADPGPTCYGYGGPLTLTDVNVLLGRIDPAGFGIPIDCDASHDAIRKLSQQVSEATGEQIPDKRILTGLLDIANERMADAIRKISIRKGFELDDYTLVAFGGAGGQHACAVAKLLGISRILIPRDGGLLSALGLGASSIERTAERQILSVLDEMTEKEWALLLFEVIETARERVSREGVTSAEVTIRRLILSARYLGQDSTLEIDLDPQNIKNSTLTQSVRQFESGYERVFGYIQENRAIQFVSIRAIASAAPSGRTDRTSKESNQPASHSVEKSSGFKRYLRKTLSADCMIVGPSLVIEDHSVTVVEVGWNASVDCAGALILEFRREPKAAPPPRQKFSSKSSSSSKAIELELFTNRFRTIVEEMGEVLRRTALSTNIKERLDFSCALLDRDGELVVNAPHIPVHLGAMGECVRRVRERIAMNPGDVIATNHPAYGGSHLPDLTVITPVFEHEDDATSLLGYVTNRAHHAEIGGMRPGSMPPNATTLEEEGVIISPMRLLRNHAPNFERVFRMLTTESCWPSRAPEENIEDLRAALAANRRGESALRALASTYGEASIANYMALLKSQSEWKMREALLRFGDGTFSAVEHLDDGAAICAAIEIREGRATVDFSGTSPTHGGNLNATPAIVISAVMYVFRLLINEPVPLNEGMLKPIELTIPADCLLNPTFEADPARSPAVVGGNVETSQRLVDTLIKALNLSACSQGTMNNILFGNANYGYYETVAGGAGAGRNYDGVSGIHTHMTNTQITDPEIIEHRYPVRINRFELRTGSGGLGRHHGGNGVIREYEFLEPAQLSVLTQHRTTAPFGADDGQCGRPGRQTIIRTTGIHIPLQSIDGAEMLPGDRLILETPGGGGWGFAKNQEDDPNDSP